ncbi:flavohemoprotein [Pandoraea nosoerga]|uniref:nitric oxide dioxygenase n=1 Tax=Pandoraea nosoerga TaxID=2508296 RepID=A0A5E4U2W8_9BURK|nr:MULTISPECIES: globin domain-containing protein [Pandoraea]MBN4668124.1 flavohemoprotein [Pandoraea nosoerga]MBN4677929.1 flavohemoprotein [Pandoraea nosoerga]MBN4683151.1 flavohemoprotein [Pandoraea nosoerga]MBN4747079.1 flavohemoprotein [Pandoraea nosoerga]VVD93893.1 flavohemoprotein [Pandoraea nosoerga]
MLSAASRPYIDASVPVLREHGLAITRHFYASMFEAQPELRHLFNMGNQANGAQQQSLASAVFAYAANIDNAAALGPVLERIVHKHVSVGITPAHYPIVGRHLLGAIKDVLGEAATPELIAAWDEAYWRLAGELIAAEARLSERTRAPLGTLRELVVADVDRETDHIVSYYLRTPEGGSPGDFAPGQYVSVSVTLPDGLQQRRQYSLSDAPGAPHWRITVKREDAGETKPAGQVSNWLHAHLKAGERIMVSPPYGEFTTTLDAAHPLVLLSAGVGVTPMMSMVATLAAKGSRREIVFAHAARDGAHLALRRHLAFAAKALPNLRTVTFLETPLPTDREGVDYTFAGLMDISRLALPANADYLLCGPVPFMQTQWRALRDAGVPAERLHREVFGPDALDHLL